MGIQMHTYMYIEHEGPCINTRIQIGRGEYMHKLHNYIRGLKVFTLGGGGGGTPVHYTHIGL